MKKTVVFLILLAVVSSSCNNTEPAMLTEEQKQAIINEIEVVDAAIADRLNNRDAAGAFGYFSENNFLKFIDNGQLKTDLNSVTSNFAEGFANFESVKLLFADRQYSVLTSNLVLSTASFTEEIITFSRDTLNFNGAMTTLFQKSDDSWQVLHVHQSYFPVSK
ncbi:MAG: nuclear transport factor 2 family protein [Bacteroidales bacterium]|nr:nuclear transport factor 2 family protein [Bacteroidales bacterium]